MVSTRGIDRKNQELVNILKYLRKEIPSPKFKLLSKKFLIGVLADISLACTFDIFCFIYIISGILIGS